MARLVLVCGMPGAGKTTLALALAQRYAALRLCPDEWCLRLGLDPHDGELRDRLEAAHWDQAQELLRIGTPVVLESGFWSRADRDDKRLGARRIGVPVELHALTPSLDQRWERIERRQRDPTGVLITRDQLEEWEQFWAPPDADELALFDAPGAGPGIRSRVSSRATTTPDRLQRGGGGGFP